MIGFAVYANSISNSFVWDDTTLIVNNPDVQAISLKNICQIFSHDLGYYTERNNFYRPLQTFLCMLDYRFGNGNPKSFHITNIIMHSLNGILIFLILLIMTKDTVASFFASALFLVHPVNTSAVTYISGGADIMALMFLLISLILILNKEKVPYAIWLSSLSFILALLSKEISAVFPLFIYFLLKYYRDSTDKKNQPQPSPVNKHLFYTFAAIAVIYIISRLTFLKFAPLGASAINPPPPFRRILTLPPAIFTYIRLIILPYDLRMDRNMDIPLSLFEGPVILSLFAIIGISIFFIRYIKREQPVLLGVAFFLIFLFPSLNIIIPLNAPISEHWLYIPFFGISLVLAQALSDLIKKFQHYKKIIFSALTLLLITYAGITIYLNTTWKNEETLFKYIVKFGKVYPRAHYNIAVVYLNTGRYEDAIAEFKKALDVEPSYYEALFGSAMAYAHLNKFDLATPYFEKSIKIKPKSVIAYMYFAKALDDTGKTDMAIDLYKKAMIIDNKNVILYNNLGIAYANKKMYDEARKIWTEGLKINSEYKGIKQNLDRLEGIAAKEPMNNFIENMNKYASEGNYAAAIEECEKALKIDENNVTAHNNLGVLYGMVGKDEEAVKHFKIVLELASTETGAYKNIGIIYSKYPDKYKEAITYFKKYLEYCPSDKEAETIKKTIEDMRKNSP